MPARRRCPTRGTDRPARRHHDQRTVTYIGAGQPPHRSWLRPRRLERHRHRVDVPQRPGDEHDAIREAAGLFDMSPIERIRVTGRDAGDGGPPTAPAGPVRIAAILTTSGTVADDAIASNLNDDDWILVHGSGAAMEWFTDSATGRDVDFALDDDLHMLSLQGPESLAAIGGPTPAGARLAVARTQRAPWVVETPRPSTVRGCGPRSSLQRRGAAGCCTCRPPETRHRCTCSRRRV